jgi:hypothetical protein
MGFKSKRLAWYARNNQSPTVLLAARAILKAQSRSCYLTRTPSSVLSRNPGWRNSDHFVGCSNFEQSLLKMMTRRKRWSNSASSDSPQGLSLVVQVSGGALARTSSVAPSIKIKSKFSGKLRVDTIFRAGLLALLFFSNSLLQDICLQDIWKKQLHGAFKTKRT